MQQIAGERDVRGRGKRSEIAAAGGCGGEHDDVRACQAEHDAVAGERERRRRADAIATCSKHVTALMNVHAAQCSLIRIHATHHGCVHATHRLS